MSSLQEHMERAARMSDDEKAVIRDPMVNAAVEAARDRLRRADAERYENYDALDQFLIRLGFDTATVRSLTVVPHRISVTEANGHDITTVTYLDFLPRKKVHTA